MKLSERRLVGSVAFDAAAEHKAAVNADRSHRDMFGVWAQVRWRVRDNDLFAFGQRSWRSCQIDRQQQTGNRKRENNEPVRHRMVDSVPSAKFQETKNG